MTRSSVSCKRLTFLPNPANVALTSLRRGAAIPGNPFALAFALLLCCLFWLLAAPTTARAQTATTTLPGVTAVGARSTPVPVTVTITHAGTAGEPAALARGVANKDFALAPGGSCAAGNSYSAGQQCSINVIFSPTAPGLLSGAVTLPSTSGGLLGMALINGNASGSLAVLTPGEINTVAGDGSWIYRTDGVPALQAPIFLPMGAVYDSAGNLFFSDSSNNRVRRVDAGTQLISTIAGNGTPGFFGDGGPATAAEVSAPAGLVLDGAGNLYFADTGNHAIRRIDAATGIITTVAGTGGAQGYAGDGAAATAATLSLPQGVTLDSAGDLIIADTGNDTIRRVDAQTGVITTIAGTGTPGFNGDAQLATRAQLSSPWSVTQAPDGSLYIADLSNNRIRRIDPVTHMISTVAGNGVAQFAGDTAAASQASLAAPAAIVFDPAGNLYIADSLNNRIRKVSAQTGVISTIAGTRSEQMDGDGGPSTLASLYGPYALAFDPKGDLLVADMFHNRLRLIFSSQVALTFDPMMVGKLSPVQTQGLENDGNAPLAVTQLSLSSAKLDASTTTCAVGALAVDADCTLGVEFAPTATGDPVQGNVTIATDAANMPGVVSLSGQVLNTEPTTVSLLSSSNPSLLGSAITLSSTVTSQGPAPTGAVQFLDGTTILCTTNLDNKGNASCSVSNLALGQHTITASYGGDTNSAPGQSAALTQTVYDGTTLTLSVTPNPSVVTSSITLMAKATASASTPAGVVVFYDGTAVLGTGSLNASGVATFATAQLSPGTHSLSGQFGGSDTDSSATSNTVSQTVSAATTTTNIASSNSNVTAGTAVTLTADVSSSISRTPTGTVQFLDGSAVLGSAPLNAAGQATFTVASLNAGNHTLTASYSGDTDDAASLSAGMSQVVTAVQTAVALASDANPADAGLLVHLTASVSEPGTTSQAGALTGQVTFLDGSTAIGTASVNSSGVAVFATSALTPGKHTLTASFAGATNYAASTSAPLIEQINATASTTTLSSSSSTLLAGKSVTFSATVLSATGTPTGSVSFFDGATSLGQVPLSATGTAIYTTTKLGVGSHAITAVYSGDSFYQASTSASLTESVADATSTLTLTGPSGPQNAGVAITLNGALSSTGVTPTGTLTLLDGGNPIGNQAASASFSFSVSTLAVGNHVLSVSYGGDANNASSVSNTVSVTVQQGATGTVLTGSANPITAGQTLTLTAKVTSVSPNATGTVTFLDGGNAVGTANVNASGTATYSTSALTFGTHSLTAVYSGDSNHNASSSAPLTESVVEPATAVLTASANPIPVGATLTLTAVVSGSGPTPPTGTITVLDGNTPLGTASLAGNATASLNLSTLAVGVHSLTVSYSGDANYAQTVSAPLVETVQSASTQVSLALGANPATYAAPLTLTATTLTDGARATGNVVFLDGTTALGSAVLTNGVATFTTSSLAPGNHTLSASYAGDGKAAASVSAPQTLAVREPTSLKLASNANPAQSLSTITVTAAVSNAGVGMPTGTVNFLDGAATVGSAVLDSTGHATITMQNPSVGTHMLSATYAGDASNFGVTSAAMSEEVDLRPTTTTLTAITPDPTQAQNQSLVAVVRFTGSTAPTGTVTFTQGTTTLGTATLDSTGVATLPIVIRSGSESVIASYGGDSAYAASASSALKVVAQPAYEFAMQINPTTVSVASKQHTTVNITLTSIQGFADNIGFGCAGLPFAASCTFAKAQTTLTANGTATIQVIVDTSAPLDAGTQAALHNPGGPAIVTLCAVPGFLLIFGALRGGRRRVWAMRLAVLLLAALATLSSTGCAGLNLNGTPAGNYTFQIVAAGQKSGLTETQNVTLNVTQ